MIMITLYNYVKNMLYKCGYSRIDMSHRRSYAVNRYNLNVIKASAKLPVRTIVRTRENSLDKETLGIFYTFPSRQTDILKAETSF